MPHTLHRQPCRPPQTTNLSERPKRFCACHEITVLWRTLLRWNLQTLFWDLEKKIRFPARADFRQLVVNFYEESERRVMAKKKFTGGTSQVCGAP
jgi:hypothetical protein